MPNSGGDGVYGWRGLANGHFQAVATRVDSFTIAAISRNTEPTEKRCSERRSDGGVSYHSTTTSLSFFLKSCFCGRSAAKYNTTKKKRKKKEKKKSGETAASLSL